MKKSQNQEHTKHVLNFIKKYQTALTTKSKDIRLSIEEAGMIVSSITSLLLLDFDEKNKNMNMVEKEKMKKNKETVGREKNENLNLKLDFGFFPKNS